MAGGAGSRRGTGGMQTKLKAAELATANGIDTIVTNGAHPEALYDIMDEEGGDPLRSPGEVIGSNEISGGGSLWSGSEPKKGL